MIVTSTSANSTPSTVNSPARNNPGARILAAIRLQSSLARDLDKVVGQRLDLLRLEGVLVVGRHDPILIALLHVGARILDRLLDELGVLALEELVEVRADRAGSARGGQRVAGRAGRARGLRQDGLGVRRRAGPARRPTTRRGAARRLLPLGGEPLVER